MVKPIALGEPIEMFVVKVTLGKDGKTYVTLENDDMFMNKATLILRVEEE